MRTLAVWCCVVAVSSALDNGRARTPPMGWMAWGRFMCQIDCSTDKPCINETLFLNVAKHLKHDGYAAAGYKRVHIDDCWMEKERDDKERLVADRRRFPRGIDYLAAQIRQSELQFGMYLTYGRRSCMGFAGTWSSAHIAKDAELISRIGADYLKFDGCFNRWQDLNRGYLSMHDELAKHEQPIAYSCSWPFYLLNQQIKPDYALIAQHCNVWRNFNDIELNWPSVLSIIEHYTRNQDELARYHAPGRWNDPDMLIIGNSVLTPDQERVQMSFWCLWSAPLIMSNDLSAIPATSRRIMLNEYAIAIDQDRLGDFGLRVDSINHVDYYLKYIADPYKLVLLVFNRNKKPTPAELNPASLSLRRRLGGGLYEFFDIWTRESFTASNKQLMMRPESAQLYIVSSDYRRTSLFTRLVLVMTAALVLLCACESRALKIVSRYWLSKMKMLYCLLVLLWLSYSVTLLVRNQ